MNPSNNSVPEFLVNPIVAYNWSWKREGQAVLDVVRYDGTRRFFVATTEDEKALLVQAAIDVEKQLNHLKKLEIEAGRKF